MYTRIKNNTYKQHNKPSLIMFISVYLFRQFSGPPVSVGTASIPDLTLYRGCTSLPISRDLPFRLRPIDLLAHF